MANLKAFILVVALLPSLSYCTPRYPSQFDDYFKLYAGKYVSEYDWRWFKSQCIVESGLRPKAVSPVGAKGICQFMPGTWKDLKKRLNLHNSPFHTRSNIKASAYYMRRLILGWSWERPKYDKLYLAQASYNAGLGHILKAQKLCNNAILYTDIIRCLKDVTGKHSIETTTYVARIKVWYIKITSTER